jgi:anti-sigma factor RsiW
MMHIADNHEALLDYLYEEGDPAERLQIARHLQECAACSVAVLEFQSVRGMLSEWVPPASELGFRVVQDASPMAPRATVEHGARSDWWRVWNPATSKGMLQAAAAVVLFVSGMAFSQLDVRYENGTVTVRPRFLEPSDQNVRAGSILLTPDSSNVPVVATAEAAAPSAAMPIDREELLQRVRSMIDQSEERQQRELALRLSQVTREVDTQHQADLLRIQQDFGQQQEATMDYLVRTSGGVK